MAQGPHDTGNVVVIHGAIRLLITRPAAPACHPSLSVNCDGRWGLSDRKSIGMKKRRPQAPLFMLSLVQRVLGQVENLTRIDAVRIPDLAGIGLIDGGIFQPFTIDAAGDRPEVVAAADDGLARNKTLRIRIAQ